MSEWDMLCILNSDPLCSNVEGILIYQTFVHCHADSGDTQKVVQMFLDFYCSSNCQNVIFLMSVNLVLLELSPKHSHHLLNYLQLFT